MRNSFALAIALSLLCINQSYGGVDFYSGTGSSVTFDFDISNGSTWTPVAGEAGAAIENGDNSNTTVKIDGSISSGGSTSPDELLFSVGALDVLQTVAKDNSYSYSSSGNAYGSISANVVATIYSSGSVAYGYSTTSDNYFLWHTTDGGVLTALGWAKFSYNPQSPTGSTTDEFTISEWAYNLAGNAGDASIQVGDTDDSSSTGGGGGQVPEPTGLAIFAIASLGLASARRRSS